MAFLLDYIQHRRDCQFKQAERAERLRTLTASLGPFSVLDRQITSKPIGHLVKDVQNSVTSPLDVLRTYGRIALEAHRKTNCLTEIMLPSAEAWLADGSVNLKGPLAGIPVSLKDTIVVGGYDTSVGFSSFVGNKGSLDGPVVRLLKDAGAVPYVKTNLPITLLSFESANDVWGRSTNPHNPRYTPGGSTGGESALLALGGRIGIGSDVAGSVRVPAHFAGCYALRCSSGRWPKTGFKTSMPGQEGVPSVYSPMARTLDDLTYFTRAVVKMQPWKYCHTVHPLEWRDSIEEDFLSPEKKLRIGVMRTDGVVDPSPACARALDMVAKSLGRDGHEVFDISPPSTYEALKVASLVLNADGTQTFNSFFRWGEWNDRGAAQMRFYMTLPSPLRWIYYAWVKYVRRDDIWAGLVRDWRPQSAAEQWKLVAKREAIRREYFEWWEGAGIDVLITPPNATPAVPHEGMNDAVSSCGYTFLFNLLDWTAGVLPVTHVDKELDRLPTDFDLRKLNGVAFGAYKHYDSADMHGLPVGVQVVGQRLEEEKVLSVMKRIEDALGDERYQLLELEELPA
ncbi:amidase [Plectosphaerella cucumerina]|uniref:amidase n=1 Tax=Plectosphaerella cucumerina TaxID=40658 RepID=A0A8K0TMB2_9PEZI|nr:amidase [Plectosphaerella cucumerina]